jgi:hypothetical protein
MAVKVTKIFKAFQKIPEFGFWRANIPSGRRGAFRQKMSMFRQKNYFQF